MSQRTMNISHCVRPLVSISDGNMQHQGTGFFVEHPDRNLLVTAEHVGRGLTLHALKAPEKSGSFARDELLSELKILKSSKEFDLAVYDAGDYSPSTKLKIADHVPSGNQTVATYEYSRLVNTPILGGSKIFGNASTRIGNIVRTLMGDPRFPDGTLETSFPALRGASGSPVVINDASAPFQVVGIIIANIEYELLPVQSYSYVEKGIVVEEQKYYLPHGLATCAQMLKQMVAGI